RNPKCFFRREGFVKRSWSVCVEVVENDPDHHGVRIALIDQPLHLLREVLLGSAFGYFHVSPARLRLDKHEEITRAFAFVFIIVTLKAPRRGWQWRAWLREQLPAGLIKVNLRPPRIIRLGTERQDVLHGGDERPANLSETPLLFQPRLELVFLSARRTVSFEQDSTSLSATTRSASSSRVQRSRPSGTPLQASAI